MYIFPAVGLACVLIKAKRVSYRMLNRAGLALTNSMTMEEINSGRLFPHLDRIREVTIEVASAGTSCTEPSGCTICRASNGCWGSGSSFLFAVARAAFTEGLAGIKEPSDLEKFISENMFWPEYASVVYSPHTKHNNVS
jgi:malic enzyme